MRAHMLTMGRTSCSSDLTRVVVGVDVWNRAPVKVHSPPQPISQQSG
jgi:hypothetical protein